MSRHLRRGTGATRVARPGAWMREAPDSGVEAGASVGGAAAGAVPSVLGGVRGRGAGVRAGGGAEGAVRVGEGAAQPRVARGDALEAALLRGGLVPEPERE